MESICCPNHSDSYCLLKTGTKDGPNKNKSFYICSKCKFVKQTSLPPTSCTYHSEYTVELQNLQKTSDGLRKYYRCIGRGEDQKWCGHVKVPEMNSRDQEKSQKVEKLHKTNITNNHEKQITQLANKKSAEYCMSKSAENASYTHEQDDKSHRSNSSSPGEKNTTEVSQSLHLIKDGSKTGEQSTRKAYLSSSQEQNTNLSSIQPLTFSDLVKTNKSAGAFSTANDSFKEKSFHQYRDSPVPTQKSRGGGKKSECFKGSDSSDSESDSEVEGAKELLNDLSLKDDHSTVRDPVSKSHEQGKSAEAHLTSGSKDGKGGKVEVGQSARNMLEKDHKTQMSTKVGGIEADKENQKGLGNITPSPEREANQSSNIEKGDKIGENDVVITKTEINPHVLLRRLKDDRAASALELNKLQSSLKAIQLDRLPDKGARLISRVKSLKEHVSQLESQIADTLSKYGDVLTREHMFQSSANTSSGQQRVVVVMPGADGSSKTVHVNVAARQAFHNPQSSRPPGQPLPADAPKTTQFSQFIQLPSNLSNLYADNPQAMTLYGGRMTAQRLREVGSITTEAIEKLHKQLESCPNETEVLDPDGLLVTLMTHQRQALAWLEWREQQQPPGGILADDMGLGKTLTMISHLMRRKQAIKETGADPDSWLGKDKNIKKLQSSVKKSRATLIVAPASLVHQWAKEIERRCKPRSLKFLVYHGPNRETNIHRIIDNDVVLTTYAIISKEVGASGDAEKAVQDEEEEETDEKTQRELPLMLRIGWERIILDEAHDIKNHKSARAQSVCRLRAAYRWALTGTPVQNDLKDMYSLLRYLRFSPFDEYKVWKKQIESGRETLKRLNTIVKALLLRRTKDQTLGGKPLVELPDKNYDKVIVELSAEEKKVYDKLFRETQSTVRDYVYRHEDREPAAIRSEEGVRQTIPVTVVGNPAHMDRKATGSTILVQLLRLRQCCSHLSLLKDKLDADNLETDGIELSLQQQMKGMMLDDESEEPSTVSNIPATSLFEMSSLSTKLSHVLNIVKSLGTTNPSDKSVIVSQWTGMLDIVGLHLKRLGIPYSLIQGNIPPKKRAEVVDDFNRVDKGAKVILISLCAGGVGLNLTGGNHLFLLDSHWNPALEEQACDRIYRIGQKKNVNIYRFICKNTIEEKIWTLQQDKLSLAKSVLSGAGAKNQKLSLQDMRMLFGV